MNLLSLVTLWLDNVCQIKTKVLQCRFQKFLWTEQGLISMALVVNFFGFRYCSIFVCIWQILFNYVLTRLKRFVSQFTSKLCNWLFFHLHLALHLCVVRFDVTGNLKNFLDFGGNLFSCENFLDFAIVALLFLFDKHCLIIE